MTAPDHERLREDLAGYVLGGLTVDEQLALEAHLAECTSCRAELADLDPVPVLLDLAAPVAPSDDPAVGDDADEPSTEHDREPSAEPVLTAVGSTRAQAATDTPPAPNPTRPRRRGVLAAAGVAVAMLLAFAVGLVVAAPSEPAYGAPIALHAVGGSGAAGTVAVRAADHGTEVRLRLRQLPAATGTWYECVWWSDSGGRWSAGTFRPGPTASTDVELLAAAKLHPGWRVAILEHTADRPQPVTVLTTTT